MNDQLLSWIVTFVGLAGFWLAGKKLWWAWYVNIANQVMWVIFALVTEYYAFLFGTAFYLFVFCRNAYLWTKEHFDQTEAVNNLVQGYEDQTPAYLVGECGNVSKRYHLACVLNHGHPDSHVAWGSSWTDEEGYAPLKARVINNPPGVCHYTPDEAGVLACRIEHIHLSPKPNN